MSTSNIKNINRKSIEAIMDAIFERHLQSRHDIADDTSLSLMTVGRVVDAFTDVGLLYRARSESTTPGRKAGVSIPDPKLFSVIADLTDNSLRIFDVSGSELRYTSLPQYDGELSSLVYTLFGDLSGELNFLNCMGIGIITGNDADADGLHLLFSDFSHSSFAVLGASLADCADAFLTNKPYFLDFGLMYYLSDAPLYGILYIDGRCVSLEDGILGDLSRSGLEAQAALENAYRLLGFERLVLSEDCTLEPPKNCSIVRIPSDVRPERVGMLRLLRNEYISRIMNRM